MYLKVSEIAPLLPDNDFRYFTMLEGILNSVDSSCIVEIIRGPQEYITRITPTEDINHIIKEILKLHTLLGIQLDMSKSIKTSGHIIYKIHYCEN